MEKAERLDDHSLSKVTRI